MGQIIHLAAGLLTVLGVLADEICNRFEVLPNIRAVEPEYPGSDKFFQAEHPILRIASLHAELVRPRLAHTAFPGRTCTRAYPVGARRQSCYAAA